MAELTTTVYHELRSMARSKLASQRTGHTLQATALVNEAWMKLRGHFEGQEGTPQFFKTAADAMRQILIDHARSKQREKRGGTDRKRVDIAELSEIAQLSEDSDPEDVLSLYEALITLEQEDPDAAEVIKLRFFGGLSVEETASALNISDRTVKRIWRFARAWLFEQMTG